MNLLFYSIWTEQTDGCCPVDPYGAEDMSRALHSLRSMAGVRKNLQGHVHLLVGADDVF